MKVAQGQGKHLLFNLTWSQTGGDVEDHTSHSEWNFIYSVLPTSSKLSTHSTSIRLFLSKYITTSEGPSLSFFISLPDKWGTLLSSSIRYIFCFHFCPQLNLNSSRKVKEAEITAEPHLRNQCHCHLNSSFQTTLPLLSGTIRWWFHIKGNHDSIVAEIFVW